MPLGLQKATLNFEKTKEIGEDGKNSRVYLAHDHQLDSTIVIKEISKEAITYEDDFYKEAKILYSHEHSNIAKVNYGCEDEKHVYIAMPYYKNGSLKDLLESRFLTVREIIRYTLQILSGINHIHSKRLMHFDIKPDNIFITDSNEAVVADFGLAKALDIYNVASQEFAYHKQMPPEVWNGEDKKIPFDLYLVGLTMYRMCNGVEEFNTQYSSFSDDEYEAKVLGGLFPDRNKYLEHIPKQLQKIIKKSLEINPADRYQNALQFMNDLSKLDECLDWQYIVENRTRQWVWNDDDKVTTLRLSENNHGKSDVIAEKFIKKSRKFQKIRAHCNTNILSKDIHRLISKSLKDLP